MVALGRHSSPTAKPRYYPYFLFIVFFWHLVASCADASRGRRDWPVWRSIPGAKNGPRVVEMADFCVSFFLNKRDFQLGVMSRDLV